MLRLVLAAIAVALLAGALPAADDSMQAQREYTSRLISMPDTAAAHVDLAKWCQSQGLADRAQKHWQEAVARDPECAEARAALGYVKRNMQWVQTGEPAAPPPAAEPSAAPAPAAEPPDPMLAQRRAALAREIQEIFSQHLLSGNDATRAEGRQKLLMIQDPAAAEPIARILSLGDDNTRRLACQAIANIPTEESSRLLAKFALSDESEEVRRTAVSALASRGSAGLTPLTNALNGSLKVLDRAAYALGEIGDLRAAPALISHLRTPETKVMKAPTSGRPAESGAYFFSGTVTTYIAGATPVVANGAVGWDLQIGAIPTGTSVSMKNPRVTIYRTIIEYVQRPTVHDALQKMLGEDHAYDTAEWRAALAKRLVEAAKAPQ